MEKPTVEDEIICYCREGRRAQDATMSFLELGFRNVFNRSPPYYKLTKNSKFLWFDMYYERNTKNYFGGVNSWIKEKRPVEHT